MPTAPSFVELEQEYHDLWTTMQVRPEKAAAINAVATRILDKKARYEAVEGETNVPWFMVGVIHAMECGLNFGLHLHCGDPLTARTVRVPKGRPKAAPRNGNTYTWLESAVDALTLKNLQSIQDWSIERICYELERYNGWGYRQYHKSVLSPYLWSYTNHYTRGKYVADGKWSAVAVSGQAGALGLLKRLQELDPSIALHSSIDIEDAERETIEDTPLPAAPSPTVDATDPAYEFAKAEEGTASTSAPSTSNFAKLNELADQGSRVAQWIRSAKRFILGTGATVGGTAALVDTSKGSANVFVQMVSDHPFLAMAVCGGIVGVVVYLFVKYIEKGLVSAAKDGRYRPRGA